MKKIYVIGDSISIQYGPFLERYLQRIMLYSRKESTEEALQNLDIPQGANGGDSSMVVAYLKAKQQNGGINADYLLVNCGLHDIKTNGAPSACFFLTKYLLISYTILLIELFYAIAINTDSKTNFSYNYSLLYSELLKIF